MYVRYDRYNFPWIICLFVCGMWRHILRQIFTLYIDHYIEVNYIIFMNLNVNIEYHFGG